MHWKMKQIGDNPTIVFAVDELMRCLKRMNSTSRLSRIAVHNWDAEDRQSLYIGCDDALVSLIPPVENSRTDDAIYIDVANAAGIITGSNPRSVLIAVYRYLRALGCAFPRPGKENEIIPHCDPENTRVMIREAASYRHREVCIEGAVSYEHVADMIDWLPKIAMNGYFIQFFKPNVFFKRWCEHAGTTLMPNESLSDEEIDGMFIQLRKEIHKRGLLYHAVGHGWTHEPYGVHFTGSKAIGEAPPSSIAPYLAVVNGKQEWWQGMPLYTNLCYSNPSVRDRLTDAVAEYCEIHPDVDYLHFWLADSINSQCECPNCVENPSDYYVMMLNELDEKLTAKNIQTKIVFLIYFDLLWAPEKETIRNPDRFTLMFAPITRTYASTLAVSGDEIARKTIPSYKRNKLSPPNSTVENLAYLRKWQRVFSGDSFDFDYHLMWDHYNDPGATSTARMLHEDMKSLGRLGLNGMNSCQVQRVFFPTALNMVSMAETLWNKEVSFDEIIRNYFSAAFGKDGLEVWHYLSKLTQLFDLSWQRGDTPAIDPVVARKLADIPEVINEFLPLIEKNTNDIALDHVVRQSWEYLRYHAEVCVLFALACRARAEGKQELAEEKYKQLMTCLNSIEPDIHPVFDPTVFDAFMGWRFAK